MSEQKGSKQEEKKEGMKAGILPACCPPGSYPSITPEEGYKQQGKEETFGKGVTVYSVGHNPKISSQPAVIIVPDIFGFKGRVRHFSDELSQQGWWVVVPDFFPGDEFDGKVNPEWFKRHDWEHSQPVIAGTLQHLRSNGAGPVGLVGFCWGSFNVLQASGTGEFQAGVSFHPSHTRLCNDMKLADEKELLSAVKCPQLFAPSGADPDTMRAGGLADTIFQKSSIGKRCEFHDFPEMKHGWMMRGDLSLPEVVRDIKKGMELTVKFLHSQFA